MRFKIQLAAAIGCAGLLALSLPAFGSPSAHGENNARPLQRIMHVLAKPRPRDARRRSAVAGISSYVRRLVEASKPVLGWPALVTEARKYLGTNLTDRKRLWCATFMNFILAKLGYAGTNSDAARSFAYYGKRISKPQVGAIAVLTRGKRGGHVGVVTGVDRHGNPIIISGNHNRRVGEGLYPRSRVIAYVVPTRRRAAARHARHAPAAVPGPNRPLDSPIDELIATLKAGPAPERVQARAPRRLAPRRWRQAESRAGGCGRCRIDGGHTADPGRRLSRGFWVSLLRVLRRASGGRIGIRQRIAYRRRRSRPSRLPPKAAADHRAHAKPPRNRAQTMTPAAMQ